jgi:hypothetical protein
VRNNTSNYSTALMSLARHSCNGRTNKFDLSTKAKRPKIENNDVVVQLHRSVQFYLHVIRPPESISLVAR